MRQKCQIGNTDIFIIYSENSGSILIKLYMHAPHDKRFHICANWESVSQGAKCNIVYVHVVIFTVIFDISKVLS